MAVLVDDRPVEQLALAARQEHSLGEVVDGVVDAVAPFVRSGHDARELRERRRDVLGHGVSIGDRQGGLDDVAIGQPPQRSSGVGIRRGHRRVPRLLAVDVGSIAGPAACSSNGEQEGGAALVVRRQRPLESGE